MNIINMHRTPEMAVTSHRKTDVTDILIVLFIFGSVVLDTGDNLMRLIKVLFVIPCCVYIVKSQKLYYDTFVKWMLCFVIFAGLSFCWALSVSNAAYRYQTLLLNFVCIYCLLVYVKNRADRLPLILKTLLFAPIILEMRVIVSFGMLAFADTRSVDGIMSPNAIGMCAGIAVGLSAYYLLTEKKHRMLYLFSLALNAVIVVLSASRKGILFMLIPLFLYYIFSQKNSKKLLRNAIIAVAAASLTCYAVLNISVIYDMVGYRIETMIYGIFGTGETDGSTRLRLAMIQWGMEWFKSKPWIGYGINNYTTLLGTMSTYYGTAGVYAHNNYIELLVNLGLIGTMIYYFIYLKMLLKTIRLNKRLTSLQLLMVCILASIIVCEYGMVTYCELYVQIILALTWLLFSSGERTSESSTACVNKGEM